MKTTSLLLSVTLAICLPGILAAQVFIPDANMRAWFNTLVPGLVDQSGIMDTTNSDLASIDTTMNIDMTLPSWVYNLDLEGIQYLGNTKYLYIAPKTQFGNRHVDIVCSAFPYQMRTLSCQTYSDTLNLNLPECPQIMTTLMFNSNYRPLNVNISAAPEQAQYLYFQGNSSVEWQGSCDSYRTFIMGSNTSSLGVQLPSFSSNYLSLSDCQLVSLDLSYTTIDSIHIESITTTGLIQWPQGLFHMDYGEGVNLSPLQQLPSTLTSLNFLGMPSCLPILPESLSQMNIFSTAPMPCIPNWPSALDHIYYMGGDIYPASANYCSVLDPDCPGVHAGISGRIFMDLDQDGIFDLNEPPLPMAYVSLLPGNATAFCNSEGTWLIGVQPGSYTIDPESTYPYIGSYSPSQHAAVLPAMGSVDTLNDFAVTLVPNIEDLQAFLHAFPARPGFDNVVNLTCRNYGTVPMDAQLTFQFDPDQSWVGSSIIPDVLTGNTATWNLNGMAIGAITNIKVGLHTDTTVPLGTGIGHVLTALPDLSDETPTDNMVLWTDSVVGSYDPNDKLLSPAAMVPAEVQAGNKRIEYVIRYQNTGTAAAERVVITDTLPAGLQLESVRFDGSSLPCSWHLQEGVLYFVHEGINLPDSTSDQLGSQGFVRFSILPETDLVNGETVTNIAHIVFDFNTPVVTPPAIFTVDETIGIAEEQVPAMHVLPNPAHDLLFVSYPTGERPSAVLVRDAMGRTVLRSGLNKEGAVDVSTLPTGIYLLEAQGNGSFTQVRFVKQ